MYTDYKKIINFFVFSFYLLLSVVSNNSYASYSIEIYQRKFIKATDKGYLVQDFYTTGEKLTDPSIDK